MNDVTAFDQQLIGQTEKTMNAILGRLLGSTGVSEPEWVTLVLSAAGHGSANRDELTVRVNTIGHGLSVRLVKRLR